MPAPLPSVSAAVQLHSQPRTLQRKVGPAGVATKVWSQRVSAQSSLASIGSAGYVSGREDVQRRGSLGSIGARGVQQRVWGGGGDDGPSSGSAGSRASRASSRGSSPSRGSAASLGHGSAPSGFARALAGLRSRLVVAMASSSASSLRRRRQSVPAGGGESSGPATVPSTATGSVSDAGSVSISASDGEGQSDSDRSRGSGSGWRVGLLRQSRHGSRLSREVARTSRRGSDSGGSGIIFSSGSSRHAAAAYGTGTLTPESTSGTATDSVGSATGAAASPIVPPRAVATGLAGEVRKAFARRVAEAIFAGGAISPTGTEKPAASVKPSEASVGWGTRSASEASQTVPRSQCAWRQLTAYEILALIGRGAFANVHVVRVRGAAGACACEACMGVDWPSNDRVREGRLCALKTLRKYDVVSTQQVRHVLHEKRLLEVLSGRGGKATAAAAAAAGALAAAEAAASNSRGWTARLGVRALSLLRRRREEAETAAAEAASMAADVRSQFVVRLLETFQDRRNLYMVLEFVAGGDLWSHIRRYGRFLRNEARFYICEIVVALEYVHDNGIIFRDLKPENILVTSTGHLKLADFGFAKPLAGGPGGKVSTFCGTPAYMAPEVILRQAYTTAADWWSAGIVAYELMAGYTPFQAATPIEVYERVLAECESPSRRKGSENGGGSSGDGGEGTAAAGMRRRSMHWSSQIRGDARQLISLLLDADARSRLGAPAPGMASAVASPAARRVGSGGYGNNMDSRDRMAPPQRGARAVKVQAFFAGVDWDEVAAGRVLPPYIPDVQVESADDVGVYFETGAPVESVLEMQEGSSP
ncbi:camp-dependent protein kinase catalytic subunit, partial [Cladochytrium tenue]